MKVIFVSIVTLMFISINAFSLSVSSIVCGLGVKDRKIIKPSDSFKVSERVYCLTTLTNVKKPTFIVHRWVFGNRNFDVKLSVKPYRRFRTWSYKTIYSSMKGIWKFEVLDKNGKLLKEKIFVVK